MKSKAYVNLKKSLGWLVKLLFRVHAHGIENEPDENEGNYILVSNHISNIDPIILCSVLEKQQPLYMAKSEIFKVPVLRRIVKALGAFPVNRKGADTRAVKHATDLLLSGSCLGIFPQGHRRKKVDPKTTEVKVGAAMFACKTGVQVLPCFIKTKKRNVYLFARTDVIVGKPISFEELGYDPEKKGEYARISAYIFDKVCELEKLETSKE